MNSEELLSIVGELKNQGNMRFFDPATKEQIDSFEKNNEISLPEKYKEWLLFSDGGEFFLPGGVQIYGVAHKPLLNINRDDRPNDSYIVIGALASGDPLLCEKEGEQISIYNHGAGRIEDDEIYPDFFAFLKDLYDLLGMGEE